MSRWLLEQTAELLDDSGYAEAGARLRAVTQGQFIAKPEDFQGGPETDMFRCQLPRTEVADIVNVVQAAVGAGVVTAATRQRGLGGFLRAWAEYLAFVNDQGAA